MKINTQGLVEAVSVSDHKRIFLKPRESETIKSRLSFARTYGKVRIGQIAVIGEREFLRVDSTKFHGTVWLEIA